MRTPSPLHASLLLALALAAPCPAAASDARGLSALAGRLAREDMAEAASFAAVVTPAIGANVRAGVWGRVLAALPKGTRVEVTGREADFYLVRDGSRTVYIHVNCLAPVSGAPPANPGDAPGDPSVPPAADGDFPGLLCADPPAAGEEPPAAEPPAPPTRVAEDPASPPSPAAPGTGKTVFTGFPRRSADAESGAAFLERTAKMSRAEREREIERAILAGNVPASLREFRDVRVTMTLADGREHTAVYRVSPDYLSIGEGRDAARIPMNPITAQRIADALGCALPTARMVDQIYASADVKLPPDPMSDGRYPDWQKKMMSNEFYAEHDRLIDRRLGDGAGLVAGHKKDVVVTNRLDAKPGSVAIYGWHRKGGKPIQGLSTVHENTYADYSHGVRLVAGTMLVDGRETAVADVMKDPVLSKLLSGEGAIRDPRAAR